MSGVNVFELFEALRAVRDARTEQAKLVEREDASFRRWFEGESKSAAAATVARNRVDTHSAEVASAETTAWLLISELGWEDLDRALAYYGVDPPRPGGLR